MLRRFWNKKFIFIFLAAAALAAVIIKLDVLDIFDANVSKEFRANLLEIKDASIIAEGMFTLSGEDALNSEQRPHKAEVLIDLDTKIIRMAFYLPKTDKMFTVGDLEKDTKEVNLDTLKKDFQNRIFTIGLTVKTDANIYGKDRFKASEITYRLPLRK